MDWHRFLDLIHKEIASGIVTSSLTRLLLAAILGGAIGLEREFKHRPAGLRTNMMANWSAENRLVQIRLGKEYPEIGKRGFDCPQGDLHLVCQEEVFTSPNPRLRRVEVSVYDIERPNRQIVKLVQLVLRPRL